MNQPTAQESLDYFSGFVDVMLLITAFVSTIISLLIPCLYYIKKQCRQHPTVLIANISLLESIANFNIVLMAVNIFAYEDYINITDVFSILTFGLVQLPASDQEDLCVYNYCVYMLVELLSISFHLCYSVDLLVTIKFPFLTGKKRRKYYYAFSLLLPLATLANSVEEAAGICSDQLAQESIYMVPLWFLWTLVLFCLLSVAIIVLSFCQPRSRSRIRRNYIRQHRTVLGLLVLLWGVPIASNILIRLDQTDSSIFDTLNTIAFFCILASTGIVNIVRMAFDRFLRQKAFQMVCFAGSVRGRASVIQENEVQLDATSKKINDQVWNLPLSGAMIEFQSQEIVHNIIQVVCEACGAQRIKGSTNREGNHRLSYLTAQRQSTLLYQSVFRNTVVVEAEEQAQQIALLRIFSKKDHQKEEQIRPIDANTAQLKQLCKKKRTFNMVCVNKIDGEEGKFGEKTVHIKNNLARTHPQGQVPIELLLSIKVTSYSHRVFEALREMDGLSTESLIESLDLTRNIQNIKKARQSLGASGSFFFFSADHRLVLKTISDQEKDRFLSLLPHYFDHLRDYPDSLLARTYGIFSVEIEGISKIYFLLMENSFRQFEEANVQYHIYDLKGSTVKRQVKTPNAPVLKDINYFRSADCFVYMSQNNRDRLLEQVTRDVDMLRRHNIMDYSLLLGVGKGKKRRTQGSKSRSGGNFRLVNELQESTKRIYSLSLIDYLQQFDLNKKMQLWLKRVFKGGGDISSVDTEVYYQRFLRFLRRIVVVLNVKVSSEGRET